MSLPNVWHHRKVADSSAKGCDLCYKPSTSVLVTPDKQDHFYICAAHLKEVRFCQKEYDEKQRKKKEAEKGDDKESKDKDKAKDSAPEAEKKDDPKPKDQAGTEKPSQDEEPRVFELQRTFYQQRLTKKRQAEERKRQAEMSQRNRERLSNPSFFPAVPKDNI
ncbi:hypothetical protein PG993_007407 [Apiospora rasikravindrae]|uniref:DUF1742-domain-containing protein n=1 Tax=Apiospora rasikravindrae TaxID=990691 RepID=A0ABR1SXE5_9PEZI